VGCRKILTGLKVFRVDAKRNLETSLRELGTDYIDFESLHGYIPGSESAG